MADLIDQPTGPGWYAAVLCWDPEEGGMPAGLWFDGENWSDEPGGQRYARATVTCLPEPLASKAEALAHACAEDIGF